MPWGNERDYKDKSRIIKKDKAFYNCYLFLSAIAKNRINKSGKKGNDNIFKISNSPKITTGYLGVKDLHKIMLKIRLKRLKQFFIQGIKFKGIIFILDIIKYIFSIGDMRIVSLNYCYKQHAGFGAAYNL